MSKRFFVFLSQHGKRGKWCTHLRRDSQHAQRRGHVDAPRDPDVAEVDEVQAAPDADVVDVEHGQVSRQRQHHGFAVVPFQRSVASGFVRDADSLRTWLPFANPEVGVWVSRWKEIIRFLKKITTSILYGVFQYLCTHFNGR